MKKNHRNSYFVYLLIYIQLIAYVSRAYYIILIFHTVRLHSFSYDLPRTGISFLKAKIRARLAMSPPAYPMEEREIFVNAMPPITAPKPIPILKMDENMATATVVCCGEWRITSNSVTRLKVVKTNPHRIQCAIDTS